MMYSFSLSIAFLLLGTVVANLKPYEGEKFEEDRQGFQPEYDYDQVSYN